MYHTISWWVLRSKIGGGCIRILVAVDRISFGELNVVIILSRGVV